MQRSPPLSKELAIKRITDAINIELNENQIRAITSIDGPVQIIAGPGSGKTYVLVLRALYILLTGQAQPNEIVMTTFTENAAFELRDRLYQFATKLEYKGPLSKRTITKLRLRGKGSTARSPACLSSALTLYRSSLLLQVLMLLLLS